MGTYKHFISAANGNFASQLSGEMTILRWNHESLSKIMIICLVSEFVGIQRGQFMNGGPPSSFLPPSFFLSIHILKGTISKPSGHSLWIEHVVGEAFLSSLQVVCEET